MKTMSDVEKNKNLTLRKERQDLVMQTQVNHLARQAGRQAVEGINHKRCGRVGIRN